MVVLASSISTSSSHNTIMNWLTGSDCGPFHDGSYKSLKQELEHEKISHLQTKSKLLKTAERLEIALAEIQSLNRQLKQEKDSFQEAFGHLKDTAFEQKYHALLLKEKCNEFEKACEEQDDVILMKDSKIKELETKLQRQKKGYQHQLSDQEIHLQQERYLSQNMYKQLPKT